MFIFHILSCDNIAPVVGKSDEFMNSSLFYRALIFKKANQGLILIGTFHFNESLISETRTVGKFNRSRVFKWQQDFHFFSENQRFKNKIIFAHHCIALRKIFESFCRPVAFPSESWSRITLSGLVTIFRLAKQKFLRLEIYEKIFEN
jgi:hypothetical protein